MKKVFTQKEMIEFAQYFSRDICLKEDLDNWIVSKQKKEIQQKIEDWEKEISDWNQEDWNNEKFRQIKHIKNKDDVVKYYLEERGWKDNPDLIEKLLKFIITL